ncbi:MAG: phosphoenolpyruvate--protein phosphotransferase [Acidobacteriota bacterium]
MSERTRPEVLQGRALSPGEGWGFAYRVEPRHPAFYRLRIGPAEVEAEVSRFREAVARARDQYASDKERFEALVGREHSYIVEAHLLMLEDRVLLDEIEARIRRLDSPERALRHVADRYLAAYRSLRDDFFRERALDFEEVIGRIFSYLAESSPEGQVGTADDLILVAPEIGLSVLARFPLERIRGLVMTHGGETSHVVIVARSIGIPVVGGIEDLPGRIDSGEAVYVDGSTGRVELGVPAQVHERPQTAGSRATGARPLVRTPSGPCFTADGERIHLLANTEFRHEVRASLKLGAEGIGLFRTEFICLRRGSTTVDEEEHYEVYRALAEDAGGCPVVIRTLDLSERSFQAEAGEGAALGMRGIRLSLTRPRDLKSQLRAIVRARRYGDLRVVLPMVTSLDEVVEVRRLLREIEREVGGFERHPTPLGVLLEVPASVLTLDAIAPAADFLSVGTNDLIQYTLAAGRFNHQIAYLYNPLHPAVLRTLQRVVEVASQVGRPLYVCGEMAAHPLHAQILIGLGYRRLSLNALAIPSLRELVAGLNAGELQEWVQKLLRLGGVEEIREHVQSHFPGHFPGRAAGVV